MLNSREAAHTLGCKFSSQSINAKCPKGVSKKIHLKSPFRCSIIQNKQVQAPKGKANVNEIITENKS